jgi:hypothetical protein
MKNILIEKFSCSNLLAPVLAIATKSNLDENYARRVVIFN